MTFVLNPTADRVQVAVADSDDMERVGDLGGVGQHRVEHRPVGTGQVQGRPGDALAPLLASSRQPPARLDSAPTSDVERTAAGDIDDGGRPALSPPRALAAEQRLVQP